MKLIGYQIYSFGAEQSEMPHDWLAFGSIIPDLGEAKALLSVVKLKYEGIRWKLKLVGIVELDQ